MYCLSDTQIDFILDDIRRRGVEMEDLQNNLLDHICCMLEQNCGDEKDFETEYKKTINQFFKHDLWEIEEETILLLKYKHYYKMKRFLYILLFLSVSYNIYVFSMMGYSYYKIHRWQNEMKVLDAVSFEEGVKNFKARFTEENPGTPQTEYTFISVSTDSWIHLDMDISDMDTAQTRINRSYEMKRIKNLDSLASIYNKNIIYIHVFASKGKKTSEEIKQNEQITKHIHYISGVSKLVYGYRHKKEQTGIWVPTHFIIDSQGNIVYERSINADFTDKKLVKFLKTIK